VSLELIDEVTDLSFVVGIGLHKERKIGHFVNELKTHMVDSIRKAGDDFEDSEDD
jgi:hypothetical protein